MKPDSHLINFFSPLRLVNSALMWVDCSSRPSMEGQYFNQLHTQELIPNYYHSFSIPIPCRWVHMVCSLYTPGIEYVEPSMLGGITLDHLPTTKWGSKPCLLCEMDQYSKTGICIGCDAGLCKSVFHVTW